VLVRKLRDRLHRLRGAPPLDVRGQRLAASEQCVPAERDDEP
jgi:hypothetical protein